MTDLRRRAILVPALMTLVAAAMLLASRPAPASAHPLGNFTVNTYSRLQLHSDAIQIRYVLDMAEIPAFQERQRIDTNADGVISESESAAYLDTMLPALVSNLELTLGGVLIPLEPSAPVLEFPDGEAGLHTLRLAFWLEAPLGHSEAIAVSYSDANYRDRLGWWELIVDPFDSTLPGTVPTDDPTNELRSYPLDQLASPRVTRKLSFTFTPGTTIAPAIAPAPPAAVDPITEVATEKREGFEALIAPERLTLSLAVVALLGAAAFGAIHALEPGHGKTLVAAYFVGARGTAPQAVLLGLIVGATHTVGVFAIGLVTLVGARYVLPEDLYPWLSTISGLVLVALGLLLLRPRIVAFARRRASRRDEAADHDHPHPHGHHRHGPGGHSHVPERTDPEGAPPWRGLVALGLADGLVPTPSTLVVLLAAVSLDRIPFGLALIAAFSLGFGAVLTALALAFVYARRWFASVNTERRGLRFASKFAFSSTLPIAAALVLVGVGLTLSARSLGEVL